MLFLFLVFLIPTTQAANLKPEVCEKTRDDFLDGKGRFGFLLSCGMNYFSVGDWNNYLELDTKFWKDMANLFGYKAGGDFKKIHLGSHLSGEVIFFLNPRLGISVGSGYMYGHSDGDSSKIVSHHQLFTESSTHDTEISAIPIVLGIYYFFPVSPRVNLYLNTGLGYYFGKWFDEYHHEWGGYWEVIKQRASGGNFGLHGGIGLEYNLMPSLSLVIETCGRYAKIGGLEGYYDYKNSNNLVDYYRGILYYYEFDLSWMGLEWYPVVKLADKRPSSPTFRNIRKAELDFSGFVLRAGIRISF